MWFDAPNDAADIEEHGCSAKERFFVCIEPERFVTEESTQVEKITGAATKVQNVKWRRTIEPEVLRTLDVHPDPVRCVFVSIDLPRIWTVGITPA